MLKTKKAKAKRQNHLIDEKTPFIVKEAYRSIRTNMIHTLKQNGSKFILITSSHPREGKTTSAVNIAMTFAQGMNKILIVDCDLRKPRIHKLFGVENEKGFSSIVEDGMELEQAIVKSQHKNLDILPCGPHPENPVELLSSEAMRSLFSKAAEKYDYIFIDTPPVNVVTDAVLIASLLLAGMFIVVQQSVTDHRALKELLEKLEIISVKPLGFILNNTDEAKRKYKYYRKYGQQYGAYEKPHHEPK